MPINGDFIITVNFVHVNILRNIIETSLSKCRLRNLILRFCWLILNLDEECTPKVL